MATKDEIFEGSLLSDAKRIAKLPFKETWDIHTNRRIKQLHPLIRHSFANAINELEQDYGIFVRLTDGFRSFDEQDKLYGFSRTIEQIRIKGINPDYAKPNNSWKTNAIGGQSFHNYGFAGDVVQIKDKKALYSNADWEIISKVFKKNGFIWMYDLIKKDKPHFQTPFGYTWQQMKIKKEEQNKEYIDLD